MATVGLALHAGLGGRVVGVEGRLPAAEVGAGAEPASGTGHHDGADRRVAVDLVEHLAQLDLHVLGEGVEPVRAVERDGRDTVLDRVRDLPQLHVS